MRSITPRDQQLFGSLVPYCHCPAIPWCVVCRNAPLDAPPSCFEFSPPQSLNGKSHAVRSTPYIQYIVWYYEMNQYNATLAAYQLCWIVGRLQSRVASRKLCRCQPRAKPRAKPEGDASKGFQLNPLEKALRERNISSILRGSLALPYSSPAVRACLSI